MEANLGRELTYQLPNGTIIEAISSLFGEEKVKKGKKCVNSK